MDKLTMTGKLIAISEIEAIGLGKKLTFRIDNGNQYSNIVEFEMYKGADYVEHLDNFKKYNKIDDNVMIEFDIKTYNWKPESENKIFTTLSAWKVTKAESAPF